MSNTQRRKSITQEVEEQVTEEILEEVVAHEPEPEPELDPTPTGQVFLGEEDKRLLRKVNNHIVNKLGLGGTRSFKV